MILCGDPRIVNLDRALKIGFRNRDKWAETFANPHHGKPQKPVAPCFFAFDDRFGACYRGSDIGICAIDTFVLADTWRPVMSIPQSTDTWLTILRDISICPFSFY